MAASMRLLRTAVFLLIFNRCLAWDSDELELFDLVEEVNANFYDVLGVGQVMLCYFSHYQLVCVCVCFINLSQLSLLCFRVRCKAGHYLRFILFTLFQFDDAVTKYLFSISSLSAFSQRFSKTTAFSTGKQRTTKIGFP